MTRERALQLGLGLAVVLIAALAVVAWRLSRRLDDASAEHRRLEERLEGARAEQEQLRRVVDVLDAAAEGPEEVTPVPAGPPAPEPAPAASEGAPDGPR